MINFNQLTESAYEDRVAKHASQISGGKPITKKRY